MPKFHQTVMISTLNGNGPLDSVDVLNQLHIDATAYYVRGETTGIIYYGNNYFLNYFESSHEDVEQHRQDGLDYPQYHAAEIRYTNKKYPKEDFERSFAEFEDYPSTSSLDAVEAQLVDAILEKMTEAIFNATVANW